MANAPRLTLRLRMITGELLFLLLAILDAALRSLTGGVLRLSVHRPRRPTAASFAQRAAAVAAASPPSTASPVRADAVVIGGASSGLAAAAALASRQVHAIVLDRRSRPGEGWRSRYASLHLHDLSDECSLPFFPLPATLPTYVPAAVFADYLDAYAKVQRLDWRGGHDVTSVEKGRDTAWRVTAAVSAEGGARTAVYETDTVVFADGGLYNSPTIPPWAEATAASSYTGTILHSSSISAAEGSCASRFRGKRVLVVGFGNSASDVIQELVAGGAADVCVAIRDPSSRPLAPQADVGRFQETYHSFPWLVGAWGENFASAVDRRVANGSLPPLVALIAKPLAAIARAAAHSNDLLLDAALAARCLRTWGDLSRFGLDALPGDGSHSPVQWTKHTGKVMVMDTGAVPLIVRGGARVVRAGVHKVGPGKNVTLDTGATLPDTDAVILCTGFNTLTHTARLLQDGPAIAALGGRTRSGGLGLAPGTFLAKPGDAVGAIVSGERTRVPGLYFILGRIAYVAETVVRLADNVAADRQGGRTLSPRRGGWLPGPGPDDLPYAPSQMCGENRGGGG